MSRARKLILDSRDDAKKELLADAEGIEWHAATADIMADAERLYKNLRKQGVINLLKKHQRRGSLVTGFDDDAIAQAVLKLALEGRGGYRHHDNAYNLIRKWATL